MRIYFFILLCVLSVFGQSYATANFDVRLTKNNIEYGKHTNLILSSNSSTPSLSTINFSVLNENFFVSAGADIITTNNRQEFHIQLYPRHTGEFTIPALNYAQHTSEAIPLMVVPAIDSKTGNTLTIASSTSVQTAWINQQVLITVSIRSKNKYIVLDKISPILATGRLLPLPTDSDVLLNVGQDPSPLTTHHTTGWAYFPTQPGRHSIELPAIQYKSDGVITHRFYLPIQNITVKPLPLYVPTNFPVGTFSLHGDTKSLILLTDKLQHIGLALIAEGISKNQLPRIENYLRSQQGLQLYPATNKLVQASNLAGITSQAKMEIPFKSNGTGIYQFADIRLQYFEPVSGKIRTLHYQWPTLFFISPWLLTLISLLVLLLLTYISSILYRYAKQYIRKYQILKQARQDIINAKTPIEIKSAIMLMSLAEDGIGNTTLQCWRRNKNVDIEPLSQALYRRSNSDIQDLKQAYLKF